jgi:asparagine synthase (glutamine-hydrolysing)
MCGIAGCVTFDGDLPSVDTLRAMADSLAHRGPDDCGYYRAPGVGLAHRRLSIIDLSANAHQPMSNRSQSAWIVYNGEIYNYRELAQELAAMGQRFKSVSDTEVVLHSYEQQGVDCLRKFNGMFAFGLWDHRKQLFFAARDRLGIKPFYYYFDGSTFVFGSEIKSLLRHPSVRTELDWEAMREYLLFNHALTQRTWYRGICQLAPGCYLLLRDGVLSVHQYWDVHFEPDYGRSFESFTEELRALLKDAVRLHLRSDVPVGSYLSGGIDSSSVVALAADMVPAGMHTFSAGFDEGKQYDERGYIGHVAAQFQTHHHEVIPGAAQLPELLPQLLWHLDEPIAGPAVLPMYRLCELIARSEIKVVNGGQGGDELFGGYPPFYVAAARNLIHAMQRATGQPPRSEVVRIPEYLLRGGATSRFLMRLRSAAGAAPKWLRGDDVRSEAKDRWRKAAPPDLSPGSFEEMSYLNLKHWLPGLLHQEDRISMAWSIESRVPLLDYRLVELAARMPSWMKVRNGRLKCVLRAAMKGIVPDLVLERRDKKGLPVPIGPWFRGVLRPYLEANLLKSNLLCDSLVDPGAVREMLGRHVAGKADCSDVLWKILNTEIWLNQADQGWSEALQRAETKRVLPACAPADWVASNV